MFLMLGALLVLLSLAVPLHAKRKDQRVSVQLGNRTGQRGQMVKLFLDTMLQPQMATVPASNIANMSLSPWTYRESCDDSRFPRQMLHAQCLTTGCLSPQGGDAGGGEGEEDMSLEAKPIYYQVLVLHKVQKHKGSKRTGERKRKYHLQLGTEVITVGCTCVRPSVAHSTPL
ncbi:interleukin 17a/f3 [Genypterus blacodes]|uniref:interleukin 17a/f3 n=1 Tax=Genypterus blacodes TaxID=154954 RepID=UPI003F773353